MLVSGRLRLRLRQSKSDGEMEKLQPQKTTPLSPLFPFLVSFLFPPIAFGKWDKKGEGDLRTFQARFR